GPRRAGDRGGDVAARREHPPPRGVRTRRDAAGEGDVRAEDGAERDVREEVVLRPGERGGSADEDREAGEDEGGLTADRGAEGPTAHRSDEGNELDVHAWL